MADSRAYNKRVEGNVFFYLQGIDYGGGVSWSFFQEGRGYHFPFMSFVSGRYIFYMSVEKNCCIEAVNMLKGSAHAVFVEMPKRRFLNLLQSWNWVD
ncbi:unnamed protein product [Lactuca virosa]|uniref:Uncharacterized protein n=1 Tax=Lactuca virosa TaxID=75947 RepID=A0AAU9M3E1_9ASTR|nr:unnamed protein product [Lactuca virosa]